MSRHIEYVSPAGLRNDGRRPIEHRRVEVEFGVAPMCDGSCMYTCGTTKILAMVQGPREPTTMRGAVFAAPDEAIISCTVALSAYSNEKSRRNPQRRSKQCNELSSVVLSVLNSVVIKAQYPGSQIHLQLEVLQHDGSEKAACINASVMALVHASVALRDIAVAATVGFIANVPLIDLTNFEVKSVCPVVVLVARAHATTMVTYMEMDMRLSEVVLDNLVVAAQQAIERLFEDMILPAVRKQIHDGMELEKVDVRGE